MLWVCVLKPLTECRGLPVAAAAAAAISTAACARLSVSIALSVCELFAFHRSVVVFQWQITITAVMLKKLF